MADGPGYKVPHRRRREQKTDYKKRLELVKSGKPRAVVRRSNKHMQVQLVTYQKEGDEVVTSARSSDLEDFGWTHYTGNLPAAYLTGFLAGKRALKEDIDEAVFDNGLQVNQHGTRIYAAVKGLEEAGVSLNAGEEAFPDESRIKGEHIEDYRDTNVVSNFEETKENISED